MINKKQLNQIKKLGIKIDHQMAFKGKSKGNKHLFRFFGMGVFMHYQLSIVNYQLNNYICHPKMQY